THRSAKAAEAMAAGMSRGRDMESSGRCAVGDPVAAEGSEPERLSNLHGGRGVGKLRQRRLLHQRSDLQGCWIQARRRPTVRGAESLGADVLSGSEDRAIRSPAQVVGAEVDFGTRTLALSGQRHSIDLMRAPGVHVQPLAVLRDEDAVVTRELCTRHFTETLAR